MVSNDVNEGICFVCKKTVTAEQALTHLNNCGNLLIEPQSEAVMQIKVATGMDFWIFIEAATSITLLDLYVFLRDNWWECCGHMSEFIVDGADTDEYYLDKTLQEMLKVGSTFHYEHNSGIVKEVVGEVIAIKSAKPVKKISVVLRKSVVMEKCESCVEGAH